MHWLEGMRERKTRDTCWHFNLSNGVDDGTAYEDGGPPWGGMAHLWEGGK